MSVRNVINGLSLFEALEGKKCHIAVQHDIIYCGGISPDDLTKEIRANLNINDWHFDDELDSWYTFV